MDGCRLGIILTILVLLSGPVGTSGAGNLLSAQTPKATAATVTPSAAMATDRSGLSVPVGGDLILTGMDCTVYLSNQIGMKGAVAHRPPLAGRTPWTDASDQADSACLAVLRRWGMVKDQRWYLVVVRGKLSGQALSYERLFDLEGAGEVVRFVARSHAASGAVTREASWIGGQQTSLVAMDDKGRLLSESSWKDGVIGEQRENRWRGNYLASTTVTDGKGLVLESVAYSYTLDGRIRQTERTMPDGRMERFVFRYGDEGLSGTWSEEAEQAQSWLFDLSGRLLRQEDWAGNEVVRRVSVTWADAQGNRMANRETEEPRSGHRTVEGFDEQGRVVQIDDFQGDELQSRISQEWDAEGNLVLKNTVGPKGSESWSAEYRDKVAVSERYAKNGLAVRVVTRQGDDSIEDIYLGGVLRMRAYFHGTEKYKEEDIRDGKVFRTRNFPSR